MDFGIGSAQSGLEGAQLAMGVYANDLANASTPGFTSGEAAAVQADEDRPVRVAIELENGFVPAAPGVVGRHHAASTDLAKKNPQTTAIRFDPPLDRDQEREVLHFIRNQERKIARGEGVAPP